MPQRISFILTTNAAGIAQSNTYLVNGYLAAVGYTPSSGQTGALIIRDDKGVLLTVASIASAGYDTDGSESRSLAERPVVGALVAQMTGGVNGKTLAVTLDIQTESPF